MQKQKQIPLLHGGVLLSRLLQLTWHHLAFLLVHLKTPCYIALKPFADISGLPFWFR